MAHLLDTVRVSDKGAIFLDYGALTKVARESRELELGKRRILKRQSTKRLSEMSKTVQVLVAHIHQG
jgi:hypothetical protein